MIWRFLLAALALALASGMLVKNALASAAEPCTVAHVIDGDTFICTDGTRVRLLLIDTPETDQEPYGTQATAALRRLLPTGTQVRLETDVQRTDGYGRTLAYVYTPGGTDVGLALVRDGLAVIAAYPPNLRHVERYRAARDTARAKRRGFWGTPAFECRPSDHRRGACE